MPKRFAKKNEYYESSENSGSDSSGENAETLERTNHQIEISGETKDKLSDELIISNYTERSIVVTGDTISHSKALKELGGSFNPKLRVGAGWIFSKARKESIENYIKTGEIKPHVFDKSKFEAQKSVDVKKIFKTLYGAFEADAEYDGEDVLETIKQVERKFS
jgi:hypothetical protein